MDEIKILIFLLALPVSPAFEGYSHSASWGSDALKLVMLWDLSFWGFPRWDGEQQPKDMPLALAQCSPW